MRASSMVLTSVARWVDYLGELRARRSVDGRDGRSAGLKAGNLVAMLVAEMVVRWAARMAWTKVATLGSLWVVTMVGQKGFLLVVEMVVKMAAETVAATVASMAVLMAVCLVD